MPPGCARLAASGVKILAGAMVRRALGRDGVEAASIVRLDDAQSETTLACDTIVLATGAAPAIELFDVAGAAIVFRPESGGHVPLVDADGRTTEPMLFGAGDCIGIKADPPDAAAAEGVRAARAAAAALAAGPDADWTKPVEDERPAEQAPSPCLLLGQGRAFGRRGRYSCLPVRGGFARRPSRRSAAPLPQPRTAAQQARDLASLASEGRMNQDQVKRLTRAGMGPCQGRRCREQVGAALAEATGVALGAIPLPSYRAPVRPLPLAAFADESEEPVDRRALGRLVRHREPVDPVLGALARDRRGERPVSDVPPKGASVRTAGAGVTGLSAAWWLARSGIDVLVFEKGVVGWEASGRNGGGATHHHSAAIRRRTAAMADDGRLLGYPTEFKPRRLRMALTERQFAIMQLAIDNT